MSQKMDRDISLDILRVMSCIMVLGVHLWLRVDIPGAVGAFFSKGSSGVGFFFVLSGYLAYVSIDHLNNKFDSMRKVAIAFWIKRSVRILPLYYLCIFFYFIFYSLCKSVPKDSSGLYWTKYLFFLNTCIRSDDDFWNNIGAVWSISCFVVFYFIAPFLYRIVNRYWSACIAVVLSYGVMKYIDKKGIYNIPIRSLFYFLLGALAYLAVKEAKEIQLFFVLFVLIAFCVLTDSGVAIASPILATAFIISTRKMECNSSNGLVYRVISALSIVSYSIYLDHVVVIEVLDHIGIIHGWIYAILVIILTGMLSIITYELIEKRLGNYILKKTSL